MATKKRTPREAWNAIEKQREDDEIARFAAKTKDEVDASLRSAGLDPARVREAGAAIGKRLLADRARLSWQIEAAEGQAKEQARLDARAGRYAKSSRAELLELLTVARRDPRLGGQAAVMFRNREDEEATEGELRGMLEELEALAERKDRKPPHS